MKIFVDLKRILGRARICNKTEYRILLDKLYKWNVNFVTEEDINVQEGVMFFNDSLREDLAQIETKVTRFRLG